MNWLIGFLSFYLFVEGVAFCSTVSVPCKKSKKSQIIVKIVLLLRIIRLHVFLPLLFLN